MAGRALSDAEWDRLANRLPGPEIYAVVTTGIVCCTGCPARTPLRRNVLLYQTADEAIGAGFRRCKRCGAGPR